MPPPQVLSASQQNQAPQRKQPELRARSRSSPPSQSYPARPQRKRSTVPMTRRFLHSVPWLSSSPDAWGRLNVVTPFHHLSGDSHLTTRSVQGPLRHLGQVCVHSSALAPASDCTRASSAASSRAGPA